MCAVKSITKGIGVYLHWLERGRFIMSKTGFSFNTQEIAVGPADFQSRAISPLIPWKYITAARSTFQTFIIEQCMMNSTRVFHFRLAWKQCQDLQWATAFLWRAHTVYLNTEINLQQSEEGIPIHGNSWTPQLFHLPFILYHTNNE